MGEEDGGGYRGGGKDVDSLQVREAKCFLFNCSRQN